MTVAQLVNHDWLKGVNVSDLPIAGSDRRLHEFEDARRRLKAKLIGMMIVTARAAIQSNKANALSSAEEVEELQKPKKVMAFQSNADRRKVTDLQQELQVVSQVMHSPPPPSPLPLPPPPSPLTHSAPDVQRV
jgi:hypothetical protein